MASRTKRKLRVKHSTVYTYDKPVERSKHVLHLKPVNNGVQTLSAYKLSITPKVDTIDYEDVFGNHTTRFELTEPYTELKVVSESFVELLDHDPFAFAKSPERQTFPLAWMPWEQKMLLPYLTPAELPDTQLQEIYDYAMSFVRANNNDVMETLFAMNLALFREFKYCSGSTTNYTTAYDVLTSKQGVCQDFANLFISMARMLNIPARYVCGYIYTGNNEESRTGSDQSHAWVQLYIPLVGWKSFDPTNGVLPQLDHVRVSYGRNYRDTAPTAGTLYSPANESLKVEVVVEDVE